MPRSVFLQFYDNLGINGTFIKGNAALLVESIRRNVEKNVPNTYIVRC